MQISEKNNCPVCGSAKTDFCYPGYDILYGVVSSKFSIFRCLDCQAMFLFPFPSKEKTETFYPKHYYSYKTEESEGFFTNLRKKIIKYKMETEIKFGFIDRMLIFLFQSKFSGIPLYKKQDGKFLDIGCGNGGNLKILKNYGWDAYGIELDENAVEYANKQGLNVKHTSIEDADFGDLKFDAIRIWHVFEHLTDPNGVIKKISDILKDDGEILMAVPNSNSFASILFRTYWYGLDVPRHVINYSPKTLDYLFKKNNLVCTEIKYASCGSFVGGISNFLRHKFGYKGNLVDNTFLVILFSPFDFISDILRHGDVIFLTIKKKAL